MRKILISVIASICLMGCESIEYVVEENVTGLNVKVTFDASQKLDQLHVSGQTINGNPAFEPALLPDPAEEIKGSEQTFTLLFANSMGDSPIRITIIGYSNGEPVAAGFAETVLKSEELVDVDVALNAETLCVSDNQGAELVVGTDLDADGICDLDDDCVDLDGDGFGGVGYSTTGCTYSGTDRDDTNVYICADTDTDSCDDCARGNFDPSKDGPDGDRDGICDAGDTCTDADGDGFGTGTLENQDCEHPVTDLNDDVPTVCADLDNDTCDDCSNGAWAPNDDGSDRDEDGRCDRGDTCTDLDGDGVGLEGLDNSGCLTPEFDSNDDDNTVCVDLDGDTCNDCSSGVFAPDQDGSDLDNDGICDAGDTCTDLDGDGLGNAGFDTSGCPSPIADLDDNNLYSCADSDQDGCDDCSSGSFNVLEDGTDSDQDSICDFGDTCTDADGDGFGTGTLNNAGCARPEVDINDSTPYACIDTDADNCDDCSDGSWNPLQDGSDNDYDGICDLADTCTDYDGDGLGNGNLNNIGCAFPYTDSNDNDATSCTDSDSDSCDDCVSGTYAPSNDGVDVDNDGVCDQGDFCIDLDQDGFGNGTGGNLDCAQSIVDVADDDPNRCIDLDSDGCDDCRYGEFSPNNDGPDADDDGFCDDYDTCVDADGDGLGTGVNGNSSCEYGRTDFDDSSSYSCADFDEDGCDDCFGGSLNWNNDGPDDDSDGICNQGDTCTDADGDGIGTGTLSNVGCEYSIMDLDDNNAFACNDVDNDGCDDCSSGDYAIWNDGEDDDHDGICNVGDTCTDVDGDGLGNGTGNNSGCINSMSDSDDFNSMKCADTDDDTCDDCAGGLFNPYQDGPDGDEDGICDDGDTCWDQDGDGFCGDADCDENNPYCNVDCSDADSDGYCGTYDCMPNIAACNADCVTNSDGDAEAVAMVDCMEVHCGSDPMDPLSSCAIPTTVDDLIDIIDRTGPGTTNVIVGDLYVDENLPTIRTEGQLNITQEPGTTITLSADKLFETESDGHTFTNLNIVVNNGADRVFDLDSDDNQVIGVTITGEPGNEPERAIAIDGDDNLVQDSTVNGYNERGIAITGNGSYDNVIRNNVVRGGTESWNESRGGIYIQDARNTLIVGNVVAQNEGLGIVLRRARNPSIVHNTMASNLVGLAFMGNANRPSQDVCARNNSITESGFAAIAAPSGVSWATREDCEYTDTSAGSSSAHGNNSYNNESMCSYYSCYNCYCLPDEFFEFSYDPKYQSTQIDDSGFYCLGESELVNQSRPTIHDLNMSQEGLFNEHAPDVGGRESGSIDCE